MRIGLVSFVCKNRDISFNMSQIEISEQAVAFKVAASISKEKGG
jgi:hypothetical protein